MEENREVRKKGRRKEVKDDSAAAALYLAYSDDEVIVVEVRRQICDLFCATREEISLKEIYTTG